MVPVKLLNIVLATTAAGLLALLGWLTDWGQALTRPAEVRPSVAGKPDVSGLLPDFRIDADAQSYAAVSERPLLNPTRRPAPTAPVVASTEPPKPQIRRGLYQLIGVMDLGAERIAQVRDTATNATRSVKVGDMLQELRVEAIQPDSVRLAFAGESDILTLARFTPSGRVPQPPAPPAPPPAAAQAAAPPQASAAAGAGQPPQAAAAAAPAASGNPAVAQQSPAPAPAPGAQAQQVSDGLNAHPNREWARMRALRAGIQLQ